MQMSGPGAVAAIWPSMHASGRGSDGQSLRVLASNTDPAVLIRAAAVGNCRVISAYFRRGGNLRARVDGLSACHVAAANSQDKALWTLRSLGADMAAITRKETKLVQHGNGLWLPPSLALSGVPVLVLQTAVRFLWRLPYSSLCLAVLTALWWLLFSLLRVPVTSNGTAGASHFGLQTVASDLLFMAAVSVVCAMAFQQRRGLGLLYMGWSFIQWLWAGITWAPRALCFPYVIVPQGSCTLFFLNVAPISSSLNYSTQLALIADNGSHVTQEAEAKALVQTVLHGDVASLLLFLEKGRHPDLYLEGLLPSHVACANDMDGMLQTLRDFGSDLKKPTLRSTQWIRLTDGTWCPKHLLGARHTVQSNLMGGLTEFASRAAVNWTAVVIISVIALTVLPPPLFFESVVNPLCELLPWQVDCACVLPPSFSGIDIQSLLSIDWLDSIQSRVLQCLMFLLGRYAPAVSPYLTWLHQWDASPPVVWLAERIMYLWSITRRRLQRSQVLQRLVSPLSWCIPTQIRISQPLPRLRLSVFWFSLDELSGPLGWGWARAMRLHLGHAWTRVLYQETVSPARKNQAPSTTLKLRHPFHRLYSLLAIGVSDAPIVVFAFCLAFPTTCRQLYVLYLTLLVLRMLFSLWFAPFQSCSQGYNRNSRTMAGGLTPLELAHRFDAVECEEDLQVETRKHWASGGAYDDSDDSDANFSPVSEVESDWSETESDSESDGDVSNDSGEDSAEDVDDQSTAHVSVLYADLSQPVRQLLGDAEIRPGYDCSRRGGVSQLEGPNDSSVDDANNLHPIDAAGLQSLPRLRPRRALSTADAAADDSTTLPLQSNTDLPTRYRCIICHDTERCIELLPCNHVPFCEACHTEFSRWNGHSRIAERDAAALAQQSQILKCPVCRSLVLGSRRIFLS